MDESGAVKRFPRDRVESENDFAKRSSERVEFVQFGEVHDPVAAQEKSGKRDEMLETVERAQGVFFEPQNAERVRHGGDGAVIEASDSVLVQNNLLERRQGFHPVDPSDVVSGQPKCLQREIRSLEAEPEGADGRNLIVVEVEVLQLDQVSDARPKVRVNAIVGKMESGKAGKRLDPVELGEQIVVAFEGKKPFEGF